MLVMIGGGMVGRFYKPSSTAHTQDTYSNCTVSVPKLWDVFKAGWKFGLAFEDQTGTLRFLLHPACGSLNSPTDNSAIDSKVIRK